jgi:adenylate kinase
MIIFFGPAGAGKSVQGQILAARHNWRWLSTGQLLRDAHDVKLLEKMQTGALIDPAYVSELMGQALERSKDIDHVIVDGFPRELSQAKWIIENQPKHQRSIGVVIVLEVPRGEIVRRLQLRGRADDTPQAIEDRLQIYRKEIYPILSYLTEQGVHVAHIDGTGTVGQVHDRIEAELESCSLA